MTGLRAKSGHWGIWLVKRWAMVAAGRIGCAREGSEAGKSAARISECGVEVSFNFRGGRQGDQGGSYGRIRWVCRRDRRRHFGRAAPFRRQSRGLGVGGTRE